jgi:hypothetical protein
MAVALMTQPSASNGGSNPMSLYGTPHDLVRGLHAGEVAARTRFGELLREPLLKLLDQLVQQYGLRARPADLVGRALRLAEVHARSRSDSEVRDLTWRAFLGGVLLQVGRVLAQPHGQVARAEAGPTTLPECPVYDSLAYYRPYERIGEAFFGGDWFVGQHDPEGALWVLMADITGHGYHAYLLACALPALWRMAWEQTERRQQPADVLTTLHELLQGVLPEGIYVEGTLLKLLPAGDVFVQPAGGSRLLLRRQGTLSPELHTFRGFWLGLMPPLPDDQRQLRLGPGDELILGTDGLFDQLDGHAGLELAAHLGTGSSAELFDWITGLVRDSLEAGPQKDDITLLLLRRRVPARLARDSSSTRAADVPV